MTSPFSARWRLALATASRSAAKSSSLIPRSFRLAPQWCKDCPDLCVQRGWEVAGDFRRPSVGHPHDVPAVLTSCREAIPTSLRCDGQCSTWGLGVPLRSFSGRTARAICQRFWAEVNRALSTRPRRHRAGSEKPTTGRCSYCCGMTVTVSAMFIPVHDPDAALGFYRDALGLEVRNDVAVRGLPLGHRWRPGAGPRHRSVPAARRSFAGRGRRPPVTRDAGVAAGCDLPLRRPRRHLREGSGVGRRGAPGAGIPALGRARLRVPRPLGQPRPHRASLTVLDAVDWAETVSNERM